MDIYETMLTRPLVNAFAVTDAETEKPETAETPG
jgi:hypothetical protein